MNLATKTMKRLGALLLVFAMVVGMLPVQAFAAEGDRYELKIRLLRTTNDPGTENETYTYSVEFLDARPKSEASVKYYWDTDFTNTETNPYSDIVNQDNTYSTSTYTTKNKDNAVAVKVVVDGLFLTAVYPVGGGEVELGKDTKAAKTYVWEAKTDTTNAKPLVGIPYSLPNPTNLYENNLGCGVEGDAKFITVDTIQSGKCEKTEDGKYLFNDMDIVTIKRDIYAGMTTEEDGRPALRCTEYVTFAAQVPDYQVSYKIDGKTVTPDASGNVWVSKAGPITVCIDSTYGDGTTITNTEFLPKISGGSGWKLVGGTYENVIPWDGSGPITVSLGGNPMARTGGVTFLEDATSVTISNQYWYKSDDNVIIKFHYEVGDSGLSTIVLGSKGSISKYENESTQKPYYVDDGNGNVTITDNKGGYVSEGNVMITVTNNANESATAYAYMLGDGNLSINVTAKYSGQPFEGNYVKDTEHVTYEVSYGNLSNNGVTATITEVKLGEEDKTEDYKGGFTGTYSALTGETLSVTDSLGRTAYHTFAALNVDGTEPTIDVEYPEYSENNGNKYVASEKPVNVTIKIQDAESGLKAGAKVSYLIEGSSSATTVTVDGGTDEKTVTIPVESGKKLMWIKVADVQNNVGLVNNTYVSETNVNLIVDEEEPDINIEFTNVDKVYKRGDNYYLSLTDDKATEVIMTVTVTDANLDTSGIEDTNDVDVETGKVVYRFKATVTDGYGELEYTIRAKDLAGRVVNTLGLQYDEEIAVAQLTDEENLITGTLYIDGKKPHANVTVVPIDNGNITGKTVTNSDKKVVPMFKGDVALQVTLTNLGDDGIGVQSVEYVVPTTWNVSPTAGSTNVNVEEVTVTPPTGTETADAFLIIRITDYAGNIFEEPYFFAVDNTVPSVSHSFNQTLQNGNYFQEDVTVTITADDEFLEELSYTYKLGEDEQPTTVTVRDSNTASFTVATTATLIGYTAKDKAGNENNSKESLNFNIIVDKEPPKITARTPVKKEGGQEKSLSYSYDIEDANLDNVTATYTLVDGQEQPASISIGTNGKIVTLTVPEGKQLESYTITATDKAGNETVRNLMDDEGKLVDLTAPEVFVSPELASGNIVTQTTVYTITIDDTKGVANGSIGNDGAVVSATYTVEGETTPRTVTFEGAATGKTTGTITLADGETLTGVTIKAVDASGNVALGTNDGVVKYENLNIKADTTPPDVTSALTFELVNSPNASLAGFYTKENESQSYVRLNYDPDNRPDNVTIKATVTVKDDNMELTGSEWKKNDDGSFTYTKEFGPVQKDTTAAYELSFTVVDKAGNKLVFEEEDIQEIAVTRAQMGTRPEYTFNANEGKVTINLVVDYRQPTSQDNAPPSIYLTGPSVETKTANGITLYGGKSMTEAEFIATVKENDQNYNSGLDTVTYAISDATGTATSQTTNPLQLSEDKAKIEIGFTEGQETNDVTLTLTAKDNAGNIISGDVNFAVDKKAPEVAVNYSENESAIVDGKLYVQDSRTATVAVTDINFSEETEINGVKYNDWSVDTNDTSKHSKSITFAEESYYSLEVTAKDLANHSTTKTEENFYVDLYAPAVNIEKSSNATIYNGNPENGHVKQYHNDIVKYTITVTDKYLDNVGGNSVQINYTLNGNPVTVNFPVEAATAPAEKADNTPYHEEYENGENDVYTYILALADGDTLTNLTVTATDNSGRTTTAKELENVTVVVDKTAPKIMLTRNANPTKSGLEVGDQKYDFYDGTVIFTVTVEDTNLVESNGGFTDDLTANDGITVADEWTHSGNRMTRQITVQNTKMLSEITATIKDSAGNPAVLETFSDVTDISENANFKDKGNGVYKYEGNRVVVDTDAPTAVLTMATVNDEMVGFYTDSKGIVYIKLKNPTNDDTPDNTVTVTLKFEVADRNLGIGNGLTAEIGSWESNGEGWTADYLINKATGTAVHTQKVDVETNGKGQIKLDLNIADLAGNKLSKVEVEDINNTVPGPKFIKVEDGHVTGTISLDRRQITSGNDTAAPYVELTPSAAAPAKSANGLELFNKSFSFSLKVNDGPEDGCNSGLKPVGQEGMGKISWTLTNEGNGNFVTTGDGRDITLDETHKFEETIHINAGSGECNTFKLTVTAVDNVGNTIIYVRNFAVDTLAPRITVEFDNNDVRNDRYFRAERTATIMVEELNFDAAKTEIDSEIKNGAWGTDAQGRHVTTIDYDVDGDYTLHVSSTDLAGNHTPDGSVNYIGVACQEFTIDLTLPIIEVFYDPDIVSGVDEDGVDYYNADQHIGVRIIEHNFSENDVVDEFYINRDQPLGRGLGEFSDNGDNHNAAIVLENGNRYFFRVNYTDLAGNVADGYTSNFFSVDTVPPTIRTISELDNEQMNVVSGDLELQFVVEDAQDNLDTVHVVMTHTNNAFETVMVSGPEFLTITPQKDRSTVTVNIANIQKLKNLDGIYTIELRAYDYAGNIVTLTPPMVISLNRFGSTFTTDDPFTKQFLTPGSDGLVYHNSVNGNLIIQEINPNRVFHDETLKEEGSVLTIVVNGRSIRLEEGEDYTMTVEKRGQEGSYWYCYTYEIDKKVFEEDGELRDGRYSILIYGVDEAGNNNTNESSEYSTLQLDGEGKYTGKIEFTIDTQAPVIITTGIESNEIYNEEFRQMQIEIADATPTSIQVYLNDELVGLSMDAANLPENTLWLTQDKETGIYTLNVNEQTGIFNSQNVRIVATDAAANAAEAEVNDFHISTSFLVRMLNSIWFYLILVAVAAGVVVLVVFSRKKKAAV